MASGSNLSRAAWEGSTIAAASSTMVMAMYSRASLNGASIFLNSGASFFALRTRLASALFFLAALALVLANSASFFSKSWAFDSIFFIFFSSTLAFFAISFSSRSASASALAISISMVFICSAIFLVCSSPFWASATSTPRGCAFWM